MNAAAAEALSVLLVDDHAVVREGYRRLLEFQGGFEIVAEAGDADSAYAAWRRHRPQITILDLMLPGVSGIEAIRRIIAFESNARILVLSMVAQPSGRSARTGAGQPSISACSRRLSIGRNEAGRVE